MNVLKSIKCMPIRCGIFLCAVICVSLKREKKRKTKHAHTQKAARKIQLNHSNGNQLQFDGGEKSLVAHFVLLLFVLFRCEALHIFTIRKIERTFF